VRVTGPTVRREPFDSATSGQLVAALVADMAARYEGQDGSGAHPTADDFLVWLVAREAGEAVACGGICRFDERSVELKRMYVVPGARGRGLGRFVLAELERAARADGYERIRLETGRGQPEAIRLYTSSGYEPIPCWGPYVADPRSVCFEKRL
jgi:GNAT superfamily N-acetyltransferase